jgi:hypothetical protein
MLQREDNRAGEEEGGDGQEQEWVCVREEEEGEGGG